MQNVTLTWTATNWITVVLMVFVAYALVGFIATGAKKFIPSSQAA